MKHSPSPPLPPPAAKSSAALRKAKLARALRDNLKRRKDAVAQDAPPRPREEKG